MQKNRDLFADFIKGLLIISVVFGHIIQHIKYSDGAFWDDYIFKSMWMFNMPLFVGISGYFTFFSLRRKTAATFLKERILYLFIPLFIWSMIMGCVGLIPSWESIADKLFYMYATLISSYWFIWAILISSVIIGILKLLSIDNKYIVALAGILSMLIPSPFTNAVLAFSKDMVCFFILGYILASFDLNKIYTFCKKYILAIVVLTAICFFFWDKKYLIYFNPADIFHLDIGIFRLMVAIVSSTCFLVVSRMIYDYIPKGVIVNKIAEFGQETLGIYLVHAVFLFAYYTYFKIQETSTTPAILYLIPAILAIWVICLLIKQIEKSSILAFLLLGKKKKK
ncbi:acyltransferase family protein [Dysgonomonas sp. 511]|uniref:acyltransferase family protein n=1 Tax=Dysgonomonas sp. 511 TaxID=2302930 RepID=UPI0013D1C133|nr:acyltransferase family protein [Dysgonomonas sp. 511]NDV79135.1 hypothetical protein [Dysgonomonas sp. 511]